MPDNAPLPRFFSVAAPDDALAPATPRGTEFLFVAPPARRPGDGDAVIVEAANGGRLVRLFYAGAGDQWEARARAPEFPTLHSERDGLRLLAVATHRAGGAG